MASFTEVISTIRRMPDDLAAQMIVRMTNETEAVEREVQAWAKDNPKPRYPSWSEWLCEMVVSRISSFEDGKVVYSRCRKFYEEMDRATAERLGIEPKAVKVVK